MAGRGAAGGAARMVGKVALWIVGLGILVAVMRAFNWDPFGAISWLWGLASNAVNAVADWFSSLEWFRRATTP